MAIKQEFIFDSFHHEPIKIREGQEKAYVEFNFEGFAYQDDFDIKLVDELPPSMVIEVRIDGKEVEHQLVPSLYGGPGKFRLSGDLQTFEGIQNLEIELNDLPLFKVLVVDFGEPTAPLDVDFRINSFSREVYADYFPNQPNFPIYDVYVLELDSKTTKYAPPVIIDVYGDFLPLTVKSFKRLEIPGGYRTTYTISSNRDVNYEGFLKVGDAVLRERRLRFVYQKEADRNIRDASEYYSESKVVKVEVLNKIIPIYETPNNGLRALTTFSFSAPELDSGKNIIFDLGTIDIHGDFHPFIGSILVPAREVIHEFELDVSGDLYIRASQLDTPILIRAFTIYSPRGDEETSGVLSVKNGIFQSSPLFNTNEFIGNKHYLNASMSIFNNSHEELSYAIVRETNGNKIPIITNATLPPKTAELLTNMTLHENTEFKIEIRSHVRDPNVNVMLSGYSAPKEA